MSAPLFTHMRKLFLLLYVLIAASGAAAQNKEKNSKDLPKLSANELIDKHLASIGTQSARDAVKSRVLVGVGVFTTKMNPGKLGGAAQLASSHGGLLLAMILNSHDYPYEKIGFDGKDATFSSLPGGGYSALGSFLKSNKMVLKQGFLGGTLSQSWPLLQSGREVKFESVGTATIDGKELYKLRATGAGSGDVAVALYFEPETFRHVRTEYTYRTGQLTTPNPNRSPMIGSNSTSPNNYSLTEEFSNFVKVDELVLPMTYVIEYSSDAGRPLLWTLNFSQAFNNEPLDSSVFRVS